MLGREIGISNPLSREGLLSVHPRPGSTVRLNARRKLFGLALIRLPLVGIGRRVAFDRGTLGRVEHVGKCYVVARTLSHEHISRGIKQQVDNQKFRELGRHEIFTLIVRLMHPPCQPNGQRGVN